MRDLNAHVTEYELGDGRRVRLSSGGYPVNFRGISLPESLADLLFAQITAVCLRLAAEDELPAGLHRLSEEDERMITRLWLSEYGGDRAGGPA